MLGFAWRRIKLWLRLLVRVGERLTTHTMPRKLRFMLGSWSDNTRRLLVRVLAFVALNQRSGDPPDKPLKPEIEGRGMEPTKLRSISCDPNPLLAGGETVGPPSSCQKKMRVFSSSVPSRAPNFSFLMTGVSNPSPPPPATVVHGADTARIDLALEAAGLLAVTFGLPDVFPQFGSARNRDAALRGLLSMGAGCVQ